MTIDAVRTPDSRFVDLPQFPFAPHYVDALSGYEGLRLHYLDEGRSDAAETFLCLHGEPTWSFLYRKMLPVFVDSGARVIAPDFFGFGRSDKPIDDSVYTFDFHRNAVLRLIEHLDLKNITLVCQDWGGLLGLTLPMEFPERFSRMIVMNTALATGEHDPGPGFHAWKGFVASQPDLAVGPLMKRAVQGLSDLEAAAYDAPFPNAASKAGVRTFPPLVPLKPQDPGAETSRRARDFLRDEFRGPVFMAVGELDPVLGPPVMQHLRSLLPTCGEPLLLGQAGHFVQEAGEQVARAALEYFTSLSP